MINPNKPIIWLDVDGVLVDFLGEFLDFVAYETEVVYLASAVTDYDFGKVIPNAQELIKQFIASPRFGLLKPLALMTHLEALKNTGFSLRPLTQVDGDNDARIMRIKNLTQNFSGVFDGIYFTKPGESKVDFIRANAPANTKNILIEDNPNTLAEAQREIYLQLRESGATCLMAVGVLHPYNQEIRDYEYIIAVDSFQDATEMLLHGYVSNYA